MFGDVDSKIRIDSTTRRFTDLDQTTLRSSMENGIRLPEIIGIADRDRMKNSDVPQMVKRAPIVQPESDTALSKPLHEAAGVHGVDLTIGRKDSLLDKHLGEAGINDHCGSDFALFLPTPNNRTRGC
jgi:hypothetical protein